MFGDEDLKGELFNKIGAESSGNPEQLLSKAEDELSAGNAIDAKKIFKELIEIAGNNAIRYEGQSQHRAAAQEYYLQAVAYEYMEQTVERDQNYQKVIDGLLSYANTAISFSENEKGITSATLAGLVCIVSGNNNRAFDIYNQHMKISEEKPDSKILVQLLYSLGYLIDALKNTNVNALSDAENYISKDLSPQLTRAKLTGFRKLLRSVVKYSQDVIESKIKMPKIKLKTSVPKDIAFNEIFEIGIIINNIGEGDAFDLQFTVDIPEDLEILEGNKSESYKLLGSSKEEILKFNLRFQTALEEEEIFREIKGNFTYNDMLGNGHKQYFGPLELELRAVSKGIAYETRHTSLKNEYSNIDVDNLENVIKLLVPSFKSIFETASEKVGTQIASKEFKNAEFGLDFLEEQISWQKKFFTGDDVSNSIVDMINKQLKETEEKLSSTLKAEFEVEKNKSIEDLRTNMVLEREKALTDMKSELMEKHQTELTKTKEEHFKELGNLNQSMDNKLQKHLADQEQQLETNFVQDMNKKSDEFEVTLREVRSQYESEMETQRETMKEEYRSKHQEEINDLTRSKEDEMRKLKDAHNNTLESTLQTQKSQLEMSKNEEIDNAERKIQTELNDKYEEQLDQQKIKYIKDIEKLTTQNDELERQIRDLKSSSE